MPETEIQAPDQSIIAQVIWRWFNDHMPGSPVSQNADAWNHLNKQIPALITALEAVAKP